MMSGMFNGMFMGFSGMMSFMSQMMTAFFDSFAMPMQQFLDSMWTMIT